MYARCRIKLKDLENKKCHYRSIEIGKWGPNAQVFLRAEDEVLYQSRREPKRSRKKSGNISLGCPSNTALQSRAAQTQACERSASHYDSMAVTCQPQMHPQLYQLYIFFMKRLSLSQIRPGIRILGLALLKQNIRPYDKLIAVGNKITQPLVSLCSPSISL